MLLDSEGIRLAHVETVNGWELAERHTEGNRERLSRLDLLNRLDLNCATLA
jgi:hypothetical protein